MQRISLAVPMVVVALWPARAIATPDLSVTITATPTPIVAGRDLKVTIRVTNIGDQQGYTFAPVKVTFPATWQPIWAGDYSAYQPGELTYGMGGQVGVTDVQDLYIRPTAGMSAVTANAALIGDFTPDNNTATVNVDVTPTPPPNPIPRYRLYNDTTKEHLYTTDLNEYNVLGANGWVQEGTVGQLLDNPSIYNGVQSVPYYRLYVAPSGRHLWTADLSEYYRLSTLYAPGFIGEGIDGYLLPTQAAGTTQLYRLSYPPYYPWVLHHWTTDKDEHDALVAVYGWVSETSPGFVIP